MKTGLCFFLFLTISTFAFGQKIYVDEGNEQIDGINRVGLFTIVNLNSKDVEKAWTKRLKEYGKVESSKSGYSITAAEIPGVTSKPGQIYSRVVKEKGGTKIWWAIDLGTSFVTSSNNSGAYRGASQVLTDFAAACYRDDINNQIADAEKALSKTVKSYEKEVKQGEDLKKAVERNKQEKANLEQKLVDNANQLKTLQSDIEKNKTDQKTAQQEVDKMKKAVEVVKQKLDKIGQ